LCDHLVENPAKTQKTAEKPASTQDDKRDKSNHPNEFEQKHDADDGQAKFQSRFHHSVHAVDGNKEKKTPEASTTPHDIERQKVPSLALRAACHGVLLDGGVWRWDIVASPMDIGTCI
jgi:hypothetical protein